MLIARDKKSKKFFFRALISVGIGIAFLFAKNLVKDKNAADFLLILGVGACILGAWFYYKSLASSIELLVKPVFKKAFDKIKKSVKKTVNKIKKKLGISEKTWKMKGTDSFNFVFPSFGRKKGNKIDFGKTRIKWNEEPGNPWKIRYIYTKYLVKRTKKGMVFKTSHTPLENKEKLGNSCPYPEIFNLYTLSRYAPSEISNSAVSDEKVEEAMEQLIK